MEEKHGEKGKHGARSNHQRPLRTRTGHRVSDQEQETFIQSLQRLLAAVLVEDMREHPVPRAKRNKNGRKE